MSKVEADKPVDSKGAAIRKELKEILTNWSSGEFPEMKVVDEILALLAQEVKRIIGEDEKGETVQIPCPDLKEGCLVYHTAFKMTYEVKHRNELRAEQRRKAGLV